MKEIFEKTIDYLKIRVPNLKHGRVGKSKTFTCPVCKKGTCLMLPSFLINCPSCQKNLGNLYALVRLLEKDKKDWNDEQIIDYLAELFKLNILRTEQKEKILQFYKDNNFDMVLVQRNGRIPLEKQWTVKVHKDINEWKKWLITNNIGVKTGKSSNITGIDIDQKDMPKELADIFKNIKTLYQRTNRGYHYFFQYEADLPKTRIKELNIDIENDGGQMVVSPSTVDDKIRKMRLAPIIKMPQELKNIFKKYVKKGNLKFVNIEDEIKEDIKKENIDLDFVNEGNRTIFLMKFGGILRKELNIQQTTYTMDIVNNHFLKPPLSRREFLNCISSLDKYIRFDDSDLSSKVLRYLRIVEEANARDVKEALGFKKERIDRVLSYLMKEGYLIKKRRMYQIIKKVEWKDTYMDSGKTIDYTMPYFHNVAVFRDGDMLVIGAQQKVGKTHIALNIIKQLVSQGKKPYYINIESGNRFAEISRTLSLIEGSYFNATHFSPEQVELEKDAITIIDWLLPKDYADTDKLFQYFAQQLVKNSGNLIIFVQLKANNKFFAENMVGMFPAFVCRYIYDDEEGVTGCFRVDYMREPKEKVKKTIIPCEYDWKSKELRVKE